MSNLEKVLAGARGGRIADVARLLSIVENEEPEATELVRLTHANTGRAILVGLTGPPGAGKSTLVSALTAEYRSRGLRVAVVAVDPSSPYTGGAILGDRIRMRERYLDTGVYIRSMANRGQSGGVARTTRRIVSVLDALGFDVVLVETVGVGQQDIDIVRVVDTVCVLTIPGAGDDIQAIKAGIIEIADVLVVNKSDQAGAEEAVRHLSQMLNLGSPRTEWRTPVVKTSAMDGSGVKALIDTIEKHRIWSAESGEARRRRAEAMRAEIQTLLRDRVLRDLANRVSPVRLDQAVSQVVDKALDPYGAVDDLLGR